MSFFKTTVFFLLAVVFLFCPLQTRAEFFYGKQKYHTIKTGHFYIHYPEGLGKIAEHMRVIAEEGYDHISGRLDWRPKGRTHVVLSDKTDKANGLASIMPFNYILLYVAHPAADSSLDHYKDYLRLLFYHEFTHIAHIDQHRGMATLPRVFFGKIVAPNGATPAWMREGMAVYEESLLAPGFGRNHSDDAEMVIRTAVVENKFPRLDQIAGLSRHFPSGNGPYVFGGKFFDWLAQKYGEEKMYDYQKIYASSLWLFSLNNKAKRIYGKSFYKLWRDFEEENKQYYLRQKSGLEEKGLTAFETVVQNRDAQAYFTPRPGGGHAYFQTSFDDASQILMQLPNVKKPHVIKRNLFGQMSFSKDGRYLAFSSVSGVEKKRSLAEVYYYDTEKNKLYRVYDSAHREKTMQVRDPDFSPLDGGNRWLVMVRKFLATDQLYVYDLYERTGYVITHEPEYTQLSSPRFSPDGSKIVVSRKDPQTGHRDIAVYSGTGKRLFHVSRDIKPDNHPVFSNDGRKIYFDSYKTGIANIFEYNSVKGTITQLTNVTDGVFQPMPDEDGVHIYVQRYHSEKTFVQKFDAAEKNPQLLHYFRWKGKKPQGWTHDSEASGPAVQLSAGGSRINSSEEVPLDAVGESFVSSGSNPSALARFSLVPDSAEYLPGLLYSNAVRRPAKKVREVTKESELEKDNESKEYDSSYKNELIKYPPELSVDTSNPVGAKKYHALPQILVPRYVLPTFLFFENAVLAGAVVGKNDPLYRHTWTAFGNYHSNAQFFGGGGTYVYSRYAPLFYVGGIRYVVDWGTVNNTRFYEQRNQGYGGVSFSLGRHRFNTAYFYEHRSALTDLAVNLTNMKPYAGLRFQYSASKFKKFANSISQETGYQIKVGGDWTSGYLGSDEVNEERNLRADLRAYLEMPWWDHHVLAVRAAGGWTWGDLQQFGVYRMGGPFGEGVGAGYSSRLFPLRGLTGITYGGDQVVLFSAEYRVPLALNVNRGIGTWPIFLDKLHMAFFVDGGDIKFRTETEDLFSRLLVAVGGELNGDFVLGYGLPVTVRGGYGIILTNRDRLGTLEDAVTRQSLKYGSLYLQLGTMF